jgi:TolB protein
MITRIAFFLVLFLAQARNIYAYSTIDINSGNVDPIPIALNDFYNNAGGDNIEGRKILEVITQDLYSSGVFRPISKAAFIENKIGVKHKPLFAAWKQINANLLLNGEITSTTSGKLYVKFVLWDTILETQVLSESFLLPAKLWRRVAHKISDSIYKQVTGNEGYFNTRIVYVSETGKYLKRIKRLAIMDQDGANHQYLTDGSDLVLTPRFSPDRRKILYLSYKKKRPQIYLLDLNTGKTKALGHFPGMSFAPRFSPDGDHVLMSITKGDDTHIYEMHLRSKKMRQLTSGPSINTSPSYSPDGRYIAFNSDRTGTRQIFVMDRMGGNVRQLSRGKGAYTEPSWSNGNLIAFTKISSSLGFTIGVMRPDIDNATSNERIITTGYLVESPAWADNGRVLVFTKGQRPKGNKNKNLNRIHMMDFTGYNERIIPTPHDASDPDWSKPID